MAKNAEEDELLTYDMDSQDSGELALDSKIIKIESGGGGLVVASTAFHAQIT